MSLKKKAEVNTTVKKAVGKEVTTIVQGDSLEHFNKHNVLAQRPVVGVSIGTTINMGDYESLRVDCWLTDYIKDDETPENAFNRVVQIVTEQVEVTAVSLKE